MPKDANIFFGFCRMNRVRLAFFAVIGGIAVVSVAAGYMLGQNVQFSDQWPLYEALRSTSAIIFAVVGAWLAIIYPEKLRMSLREGKGEEGEDTPNFKLLLTPAVSSAVILIIVLAVGVAAPLLKQVRFVLDHLGMLRGISFSLLVFLTVWQMVIVVVAILPVDFLLAAEADTKASREIDEQVRGFRQRLKGDKPNH